MKDHKRLGRIAAVMFMLLGIITACYPMLSNYLYDNRADSIIKVYEQQAEEQDTEKEQMLSDARAYNADLETICTVQSLFSQKSREESEFFQQYGTILNVTETGMMGFVEIPSIEVYLPIYHGTEDQTLLAGVGHLVGSSFPVGGASTHAVLTGHSGLSSARLFTDLPQLVVGDHFLLHILGDTLYYKVDQIKITRPEETQELQIVPGEDHVTLLTCTPYGINSHRLLVRGIRMTDSEVNKLCEQEEAAPTEENPVRESVWMQEYRKALIIGAALSGSTIVLTVIVMQVRRRRL